MTFGQKIRNRREELGYAQTELAQKVHTTQPYVSRLELGHFNQSMPMTKKFFAGVYLLQQKGEKMYYLTVAEMADLKNCKGRMQYMIPVSALSEDLQAKYYAKIKKDAVLAPEVIEDKPEKPVKSKKQSRSV